AGTDGIWRSMSCVPVVEQSAPGVVDRFVAGLGGCRGGRFAASLCTCGCDSTYRNRGFVSGGYERGRLWPDSARYLADQRALECMGSLGGVAAITGASVRLVVPEAR